MTHSQSAWVISTVGPPTATPALLKTMSARPNRSNVRSANASTEDLVGFTSNHFVDLAKNFFSKTRWSRQFKLVRGYPQE